VHPVHHPVQPAQVELARPRLQRGRGFLFLTPARLAKAEGYFHRYGAATVFVARFITGLRVVAAPAAGALTGAWVDPSYACRAGAVDGRYSLHGVIDMRNGTSSAVTMKFTLRVTSTPR